MKRTASRPPGFTVIELLIVLSILGILVVALAPGVRRGLAAPPEEPPSRNPQKRTVADIRNTGTAMFSWLTDQVGAAAAGATSSTVDFRDYPPIRSEDLATILVPEYIKEVPLTDGWGNDFDYTLNVDNPMADKVMAIRSPGRDGFAEADVYTVTGFDPDDFDQDLVWADGFFVRWPRRD
jgi:prepilin-type N-terminal cleavage/methylation domain-containing protein